MLFIDWPPDVGTEPGSSHRVLALEPGGTLESIHLGHPLVAPFTDEQTDA